MRGAGDGGGKAVGDEGSVRVRELGRQEEGGESGLGWEFELVPFAEMGDTDVVEAANPCGGGSTGACRRRGRHRFRPWRRQWERTGKPWVAAVMLELDPRWRREGDGDGSGGSSCLLPDSGRSGG